MGTRTNDWQGRLDARISAYENTPFDWQRHNCTSFAADWVRDVTGHAPVFPKPASARAALRDVSTWGGLHANACRELGEPVPGAFARCGDVVLLNLPRSRGRVVHAFGICIGSVCAAPGPLGLMMVPVTEAGAAWRV